MVLFVFILSKLHCYFCSVDKSCPSFCDPKNCSAPDFPVLHSLPKFAQTKVHWVSDAIQPSHLLWPASPVNRLCIQLYPTLCDPMDCSPPGFSVHRIPKARILEWGAISFSRESYQPRDWTHFSYVSCIVKQTL